MIFGSGTQADRKRKKERQQSVKEKEVVSVFHVFLFNKLIVFCLYHKEVTKRSGRKKSCLYLLLWCRPRGRRQPPPPGMELTISFVFHHWLMNNLSPVWVAVHQESVNWLMLVWFLQSRVPFEVDRTSLGQLQHEGFHHSWWKKAFILVGIGIAPSSDCRWWYLPQCGDHSSRPSTDSARKVSISMIRSPKHGCHRLLLQWSFLLSGRYGFRRRSIPHRYPPWPHLHASMVMVVPVMLSSLTWGAPTAVIL